MGRYLNSSTSYVLYKNETMKPYFVDKTKLLSELFPFLEVGNTHICITRPRRFGKTMIANMIASFLGKRKSENGLFESLNISQNKKINMMLYSLTLAKCQENVIHIENILIV